MAKSKKTNYNRIPTTIVEARRAGMKRGMAQGITLMFTALLEGGYLSLNNIDPVCERVGYLVDSIDKGYVNIADLVKSLHDEYGISYE